MIRALLVDDESPARSELRYLLAEHDDVEVVGEAASAQEALTLARDLRYDVVFLDVEMPGLTGVEAAPLVRERRGPPPPALLAAPPPSPREAVAGGGFGYPPH